MPRADVVVTKYQVGRVLGLALQRTVLLVFRGNFRFDPSGIERNKKALVVAVADRKLKAAVSLNTVELSGVRVLESPGV